MDSRIQIVVAAIEQDLFSRTLCSEKLAQRVNLSPSRLQHLFKAETGETLLNHLKSSRMQAAEILMRTEFLSGKEVMSRVGLLNYSNFIHDLESLRPRAWQYRTRIRR